MPDLIKEFGLSPETAVFSCRSVVDGSPVLRVSHDPEGDWQFLCGGDHTDETVCPPKVMCLSHILDLDPGLKALGDLCTNWHAIRDSKDKPWVRHDQSEDDIRNNIEEYGWHVTLIEEDDEGPGFAYSIGLHKTFNRPEVIVFGLPTELMHFIINRCGDAFKAGRSLELNTPIEGFLEGFPVQFRKVKADKYRPHFGYGIWYYSGTEFPAIQCCWPDKDGNFPWEEGFPKEWKAKQPLLT